jgi:hypothetical protein
MVQIRSKNEIRESIKQVFPQRECFALVRPADDEAVLRSLDSADPMTLRPAFRAGLNKLTNRVFQVVAPKTMSTSVSLSVA